MKALIPRTEMKMRERKSEMAMGDSYYCDSDNHEPTYYVNSTTATIPKTAKKIDHSNYFMCMCKSLKHVQFESPSSLSKIGIHAFYKCSSLTSIDLPPSVSSIGMDAFSHCSALLQINFPSSLVTIFPRAFHKCTSLCSVWFPPSLVHLGKFAFFDCVSLVTVAFSPQIQSQVSEPADVVIGKDAFYGCSSLTSIVLPSSLSSSSIEETSLFQHCDILQLATSTSASRSKTTYSTNSVSGNDHGHSKTLVQWLQNRFRDLPLHQICYDAKWSNHHQHDTNTITNTKSTSMSESESESIDSDNSAIRHYLYQNQHSIRSIHAVDELGMNALHVLVCNPQVTADQIKALIEVEVEVGVGVGVEIDADAEISSTCISSCHVSPPPLVFMEMVNGMTPVDLFLACRGISTTSKNYKHNENEGSTRQQHGDNFAGRLQRYGRSLGTGGREYRYFTLFDAIDQGMTWNEIECLLILDRRFVLDQYLKYSIEGGDELSSLSKSSSSSSSSSSSFGLNPLLHASINDSCSLDVLYNLAKYNINLLIDLCKK